MKLLPKNLLLPISIVVAGLLIGAAIFGAIVYVNRSGNSGSQASALSEPIIQDITYRPISSSDHIRGNIDAKVKLIDYSDLECPFCKAHHVTLKAIFDKYNADGFAWVYRHFPIPALHKQAIPEAVASECVAKLAGEDGFWAFINTVYTETKSNDGLDLSLIPDYAKESGVTDLAAFKSCYENEDTLSVVNADATDAENAKGNGTPYGVLTSERKINKNTREAIFKELQNLGAPELVTFSKDGSAVGISGAIPLETYGSIVTILIDYNKK